MKKQIPKAECGFPPLGGQEGGFGERSEQKDERANDSLDEVTQPMDYAALVSAIEQTHNSAQRQAVQAVNVALTMRNWLIGYDIVEYEQRGSDRAKYGERLLDELARDLRRRIGRGFTKRYLEMFRQFYLNYFGRLFRELPWTHFIEFIRMDDPLKRAFYEVETLKNRWSVRELRKIDD
ncbi:DUF1016 domain-containing protein [Candidatus Poribacteria bacterium]|nr:DUF1016 domain-containing protein [Candidatus Poribacteria bacterium]